MVLPGMPYPNPLSPGQRAVLGLLFIAAGIMPMLAAFDIGPIDSRDINGPPWLGLVAGGIFALAGLIILAGRLPPLVSSILALVLIAAFAALSNWIAFGAGERHCSGSISLPIFWGEGDFSDLGCRIPFGLGALVVNSLLVMVAAKTLQQALGGPPRLARLVRGCEWFLFATLAPILLPFLIVIILRAGGGAVVTRIRTGQWPRNEEFIARQMKRKAEGDRS